MNADALIRLNNLKALGKKGSDLAADVGGSASYWSDMLAGNKSFGEKVARKIEEKYSLPRGYLDEVRDRSEASQGAVMPGEIKALHGLFLAIAPEFRGAAIAAATQVMISFLSPHTNEAHDPGARDTKPSESPLASQESHKTP